MYLDALCFDHSLMITVDASCDHFCAAPSKASHKAGYLHLTRAIGDWDEHSFIHGHSEQQVSRTPCEQFFWIYFLLHCSYGHAWVCLWWECGITSHVHEAYSMTYYTTKIHTNILLPSRQRRLPPVRCGTLAKGSFSSHVH